MLLDLELYFSLILDYHLLIKTNIRTIMGSYYRK